MIFDDITEGVFLVVDKSNDIDQNLLELQTTIEHKGYHVTITYEEDSKDASIHTKNILGLFSKKKTCFIIVLSGSKKKSKKFNNKGEITIYYYKTNLQRVPFCKTLFTKVIILDHNEGQFYSKLAKAFVETECSQTLLLHDINMLLLVLYHNLINVKGITNDSIIQTLDFMSSMETFEDQYISSLLQCKHLARIYKKYGEPKKYEFTQHLSRYSQIVSTKKKLRNINNFDENFIEGIIDGGIDDVNMLHISIKDSLLKRFKILLDPVNHEIPKEIGTIK
jgi:hypothetical protein